jgi:hypothetical protein
MSAQTGLITVEIKDIEIFREACEESYITISDQIADKGAYDVRIEFQTVAQVFVCGQLFLKKMIDDQRIQKDALLFPDPSLQY